MTVMVQGKSGFQRQGGGGGPLEPPKTEGRGCFGKGVPLTGPFDPSPTKGPKVFVWGFFNSLFFIALSRRCVTTSLDPRDR